MADKERNLTGSVTRRSLLQSGALASGGMLGLASIARASTDSTVAKVLARPRASSYLELLRVPDSVTTFDRFEATLPAGINLLSRSGVTWTGKDVAVDTKVGPSSLKLTLTSPKSDIAVVHVRWRMPVVNGLRVLGDAWERSYGDLGWRDTIPERVLPWYFATFDGASCHGYGVKTDARAFCFWQLDQAGVSLWLNVTNGGSGVALGERLLEMATVVTHQGSRDLTPMESVTALCKAMCARPRRKGGPIYGANDWDYSYGHSTAETIVRDTETIVDLSPTGAIRPFSVIDGGWSNGTVAWPDMEKLAALIKLRNARPGIWIRPLEATTDSKQNLLLPKARFGDRTDRARELAFDPTIPEAREKIAAKFQEAVAWGYEMVKHDFSTYDLLGQWGFEMGPQPTLPGWQLYDRSRTNAEVVSDLYAMLRATAGDRVLIDGCNAIGHLGQGIFEMQRSGDDTSGRQWERTRRMGLNTLSFRLPQHDNFFVLDADIVPITGAVPWELSRQWLDVVARSGTATILSIEPKALMAEQRAAIREAFQIAAAGGAQARPVDWMETSAPEDWRGVTGAAKDERHYNWNGPEGAWPFLSP